MVVDVETVSNARPGDLPNNDKESVPPSSCKPGRALYGELHRLGGRLLLLVVAFMPYDTGVDGREDDVDTGGNCRTGEEG